MPPNSPNTSPNEAPKNLSDLHDLNQQNRLLEDIAKSHGLNDEEKKMFTEKYKKAVDNLLQKYQGKKEIIISEIGDILQKFKDSIQHEKNDDDDFTEFSANTPDKDVTDVDNEKKL